jgi:hypothetical protein
MTESEQQVVRRITERDINRFPPFVDLIGDEAVLDGHFNAQDLRLLVRLLDQRAERAKREVATVTR